VKKFSEILINTTLKENWNSENTACSWMGIVNNWKDVGFGEWLKW
jgi:hypothetical protein